MYTEGQGRHVGLPVGCKNIEQKHPLPSLLKYPNDPHNRFGVPSGHGTAYIVHLGEFLGKQRHALVLEPHQMVELNGVGYYVLEVEKKASGPDDVWDRFWGKVPKLDDAVEIVKMSGLLCLDHAFYRGHEEKIIFMINEKQVTLDRNDPSIQTLEDRV